MERESFTDEETAAYMNEHFVPVKVDREERPDVDAIYMEALQGMTGGGGWPLTAFCDPDGVPFHCGTYFPPELARRHAELHDGDGGGGRGLGDAARRDRGRRTAHPRAARRDRPDAAPPPTTSGRSCSTRPSRRCSRLVDEVNGGFGSAPKFPPASALDLLLARGEHEPVELTLDAMAAGGIHDQLGGGFARYAVDAGWIVPHFEKMLYDNALLARTYLRAHLELGHERYRRRRDRDLRLGAARDAGARGRLLLRPRRRLGGRRGALLHLDPGRGPRRPRPGRARPPRARPPGPLRDRASAASSRAAACSTCPEGLDAPEPAGLDAAKAALLAERETRTRPGLDDKRLCSWNALMAGSLAEVGAALGEPRYVEAARRCAEFVLAEMRDGDGRLLRAYNDGRAHLNAYLEDHAYLLEALLTLYESTFEVRWFEEARGSRRRWSSASPTTSRAGSSRPPPITRS